MKKASIIVPIYNLEHCLKRCLVTLANQTYTDFEVILVDDGSEDGSYDICHDYCEQDERFQVLHFDNHGVSFARNRGIEVASGEYIMFIDGDDEVLPDMLSNYVDAMEVSRADIVIGGMTYIEKNGRRIIKQPAKEGVFRQEIWNEFCKDKTGIYGYVPNKMYRAELLRKEELRFREDMPAQEDLEFALSYYSKSQLFCLITYSGYLYYHVQGKRNISITDLIGNQMKLLECAYKGKASKESLDNVITKLQEIVYGALFHSEDKEDIYKLSKIANTRLVICCGRAQRGEKKWILKLFLAEHYTVIYLYFRMRKRIKQFLGMSD